MPKQPIFSYTKSLFYKIWLIFSALIIIATFASSVVVYIQVSNQLKNHIEQRLLWEASFYRQQLDEVFLKADQRLDSLVNSSTAVNRNYSLLQNEMNIMQIHSHSIIRSWMAYSDGYLIPSPGTRPEYVRNLPWWREYLSGETPENIMDLSIGSNHSLVGKPFIDQSAFTTLVPIYNFSLDGTKIIRAAGAQIDLNSALTDNPEVNVDWSNIPVSVYTTDGILVASPYQYYSGNLKSLNRLSNEPLIHKMLINPNNNSGFGIYLKNNHRMVGYFLKDSTLGLVLVVEYPTTEVLDPIYQVASGPLVIVLLLLLIATVLIATIYTNTKRLRRVEQLARSAELRALQAHINPHFLFNTLDCIVGFAVSTGNNSLVKMIRSLINIFRYTIRDMGELVTIREELDYLNEYISLQQIRYGSRFSFKLSVPDELLNYKIFKFCIQPLVENCFVHGVEKSFDPVAITVQITQTVQEVEIKVSDNGPGITRERLSELSQSLEQETYESESQGHGVGISNIHHRLRYAFGSLYGITIESKQGFIAHLKFPIKYTCP